MILVKLGLNRSMVIRMQNNIVPKRLPTGKVERAISIGELALRLSFNVTKSALSVMARGGRPNARELLMNTSNIETMTNTLARMRGAAMKFGQILSMDDQDILSPELCHILSRLREQGYAMPPKQLRKILDQNWGSGWLGKFSRFEVRPFAAASIGQVHKAVTKEGRTLAIKVQFPNIQDTISSDIKNLNMIIKAGGFLPQGFDLDHYLEVCEAQLLQETDYEREAEFLQLFNEILNAYPDIKAPEYIAEFSTASILCMSYSSGWNIDQPNLFSYSEREKIAKLMVGWTLQEIFDFQLIQSDPNFANYRFDTENSWLILLDFGATVCIPDAIVSIYRDLLVALLKNDQQAFLDCMNAYHLLPKNVTERPLHLINDILSVVFKEFHASEMFSFAESQIFDFLTPEKMQELGKLTPTHLIATELLLTQRKLIGIVFLLRRLKVTLPLKRMIEQKINSPVKNPFRKHLV